jgi:hypothetical protein
VYLERAFVVLSFRRYRSERRRVEMDSAVWVMQAVIDQRRREREADATALRQVGDTVRKGEATVVRARPFRRHRRFVPAAAGAVAAAPEPARDEFELVAAGDAR